MGWADIAALGSCSDAAFHALAGPLGLMTSLTYTATHGSYYNASTANSTVEGWARSLSANPPAGMRALLFIDPATRRGVVAFRGTDLDTCGISGQADACADHLLFAEPGPPPAYCEQFASGDIDYLERSLEFVALVEAAHPGLSLLFTGHSLGAGLAMMTSVAGGSPRPCVGFGTPPWLGPLRRRTGLSPSASSLLFAVADAYDPVEALAVRDRGLAGQVCRWGMREPPPAACTTCFAGLRRGGSSRSTPCDECFRERHIYAHYMVELRGPRPDCVNASNAQLPDVPISAA